MTRRTCSSSSVLFSLAASLAAAVLAFPAVAAAQSFCSDPDFLRRFPIQITQQPQNQTIAPGATATLTVGAVGICPMLYWWYVRTSDGQWQTIVVSPNSSYTTPPLAATQQYKVTVDYYIGVVAAHSNVATITVLAPATIFTQPASQAIDVGATATLSVEAIGPSPQTYQWYVGTSGDTSSPIGGATASSYTTPPLTAGTNYWVRVSNPYGPADSATATITVGLSPAIATQPQSQVIVSGSTATMSVAATGSAPLTYQWYAGTSGDVSNPIGGATAGSYTTPPLTTNTNYWVRVSNPFGTTNSATAAITIAAGPSITTPLASDTVCRGTFVTMHVNATGIAPLSYQWYVGASGDTSTPAGAGNDYTMPPLTATTSFWVRVSNPYGTADSNTATFTIHALSVTPGSATFGASGGNGSAAVTLNANCRWNAETAAGWISLGVTTGLGDGTMTFAAAPNRTGVSRSGSITIRSGVYPGADQTVLVTERITRGDFDGEGKADVLLRNSANGQNIGWLMNGLTVVNSAFLPTIADTNWDVKGVGDFDGDGKSDVVWRNKISGQDVGWLMNGLTVSNAAFLPTLADTNWEIVGIGDLNADGKADVVWRNNVSGQNIGWLMNGLTVANAAFLPTIADTNWEIVGIGDLNGDGKADVVWRNKVSGENIGWLMNGLMVSNSAFLPTIADTNWQIVGVGNVDGDGKADVLWRNSANGQDIGWLMDGLTVVNAAFLPTIADTNWEIKAIGDLDGDGRADVILRNKLTGQNIGWLMNGLTVVNSAFLPTIADTNWQIVDPR